MKYRYLVFYFLTIIFSCSIEKKTEQKYLRWVGDIEGDKNEEKNGFNVCYGDENIRQYFNMGEDLQFEGEKSNLVNYFVNHYKPVVINQSGWIRVRFIVNCHGESGRFRMIESDEDYKERPFDNRISKQLFELTKSLRGWKVLKFKDEPVDYYQYIIFKINNGNIEKIMP